jgi:spore germination protein KB
MQRISQSQLASMIIMFQIGSTPLFLLASKSGKDSWISVLIGMLSGLILMLVITLPIYRREPERNLIEIFNQYFGKVVGSMFGGAYIIYFGYGAIRNVREFGELMNMYLLPRTPTVVIMISFLAVAVYVINQGIEGFARITEIILPVVIIVYFLIFLLIYCTGLINIHQLQPILEDGFKKVLDNAIPEVISFPFGEMVLFLMFWKFASSSEYTSKVTLASYLFVGIFIALTNIFIVSSLGPLTKMSIVPLMQMTSLVQLADFIERLDPLVAILIFTGVFVKMTAYFMGAVLGLSQLIRINRHKLVLPIGGLILVGALMFKSYIEQVWVGFEVNLKVHFPIFQILIPVILLLVMLLRARTKGSGASSS